MKGIWKNVTELYKGMSKKKKKKKEYKFDVFFRRFSTGAFEISFFVSKKLSNFFPFPFFDIFEKSKKRVFFHGFVSQLNKNKNFRILHLT